jgi:hypothetical protein
MPFDAFISYSSKDKATADAACVALESAGIRCWIAPRNIRPGLEYATGIIEGIDASRVMVLIFSSNSNASPQIHREIERAVSKGLTIIPFRIEEILPTEAMEYYLGSIHWLDALKPPVTRYLQQLTETVKAVLQVRAQAGPEAEPARPIKPPFASSGPTPSKRWLLIGTCLALVLVIAGAFTAWKRGWADFMIQRPQAITQTQQILQNIVRASNGEPLDFSGTTASSTLNPIELSALSGAMNAGYPPELLLWLFTDQFQLYINNSGVGYKYSPPDDYGCSRFDPINRCYVDWIRAMAVVGVNVQTVSNGTPPVSYSRFCFDQALATEAMTAVSQETFVSIASNLRVTPSAVYGNSPVSCQAAWNPTANDAQAQPGLAPVLKLPGQTDFALTLKPRSIEGMIRFLGTLLHIQRDQIKPSGTAYVPSGRSDVLAAPTLVTVHDDPNLLTVTLNGSGPCFVETLFDKADYCVPSSATTTKNIFAFLIQLLGYSGTKGS